MAGNPGQRLKVRKMTPQEMKARQRAEKKAKGHGVGSVIAGWPGLLVAAFGVLVVVAGVFVGSARLGAYFGAPLIVTGLAWFAMGSNPMAD